VERGLNEQSAMFGVKVTVGRSMDVSTGPGPSPRKKYSPKRMGQVLLFMGNKALKPNNNISKVGPRNFSFHCV
jgi:hypothetical protein